MKYIVMESHPGYAVLLDEDGRFVKAADLHYEVGDTVTDPVLMHPPRPARRRGNPWAFAAGALAACLTLVIGLLLYRTYMTPVSSIVLRINPEVRMALNEQGRVVSVDALNEDGAALLEDFDSRGQDSLTVTAALLERAAAMGYLTEGGTVTFSIDAPDEEHFNACGAAMRQAAAEWEETLHLTVDVLASHDVPDPAPTPEPAPEPTPDPAPVVPDDDDDEDDDDGDDDDDDDEDDDDDDGD